MIAIILSSMPVAAAPAQERPEPVMVRQGSGQIRPPLMTLMDPTPVALCGDVVVAPVQAGAIAPAAAGEGAGPERSTLHFAIDADGRTRDIRPAQPGDDGGPRAWSPETQAELASWRFPAAARSDCRLEVAYAPVAVADADDALLARYFAVTRTTGALREAVERRLGGPQGDCFGPRRAERRPLRAGYPDFLRGPRPAPGVRSWTIVGWDVDAEGQPVGVRTVASSGDQIMDAEGRRAMQEMRLTPGPALTGCVYNFYRNGETLTAPGLTPEEERRDPLQNCPQALRHRMVIASDLRFPAAFETRSIEGWALVRFDVAPWGQIANVAVIEAQPAAAFGDAAQRLIQRSRAEPGFEAGVRCVVPVRYRIPDGDAPSASEPIDGLGGGTPALPTVRLD